MVAIALVAFGLGALTAQRFKVLALLPICVAAFVSSFAISTMSGQTFWQGSTTALTVPISIQVGYFVAILISSLFRFRAKPAPTSKHRFTIDANPS
jgi:hypothetical protein